jgi:hypothetical protein
MRSGLVLSRAKTPKETQTIGQGRSFGISLFNCYFPFMIITPFEQIYIHALYK